MDSQLLRACLDADVPRMRDLAGTADLAAAVPTCPDWTMNDLIRHVAEVYLFKVELMRRGSYPPDSDPWPPEGVAAEPTLPLLDRAYAELTAEFDTRGPEQATVTWYEPDQTVGFWIRDMANETVLHRIDAELAAGEPVGAIPADLAVDGIDELLAAFLHYDTTTWPDRFASLLADVGSPAVSVLTPDRSWRLHLTPEGVRVIELATPESAAPEPALSAKAADSEQGRPRLAATVEASAPDLLRWLWNRGGPIPATTGDPAAAALLRAVIDAVMTQRYAD